MFRVSWNLKVLVLPHQKLLDLLDSILFIPLIWNIGPQSRSSSAHCCRILSSAHHRLPTSDSYRFSLLNAVHLSAVVYVTTMFSARPMTFLPPWLQRLYCFDRHTLYFPWWFHARDWLVMLSFGFRSVWLIHLHFLFLISCSIGTCPVLSQRRHLMLWILRRYLLIKVCNLWEFVSVVRHVSEP